MLLLILKILHSPITEIPAPVVTIQSVSSAYAVGDFYSLTCIVSVVPHLVEEPTIEWRGQDGNIVNSSSGTSLELIFQSLTTSDSGVYTCTATVMGFGPVTGSSFFEILLVCKTCTSVVE